ncbi:MAG: hypothetical protein H7Y22_10905 [Gemmatimonadaceae bacterium]|nr:hypothetical protein [Gloeobacterales cyanobacterium ES-bin-141]
MQQFEHWPTDIDPVAIFWLTHPPADALATRTRTYPPVSFFTSCRALSPVVLALTLETEAEYLHLPLVLSTRGLLFAEAIGVRGAYHWQPEHLQDSQKQVLYAFARTLLYRSAQEPPTPGVYLVRFAVTPGALHFERLIPFPDESALVTRSSQIPDLFTCHWRCSLGLPVIDVLVHRPAIAYQYSEGHLPSHWLQKACLMPQVSVSDMAQSVQVQGATLAEARVQLLDLTGDSK